jgi:predicted phage tail protein
MSAAVLREVRLYGALGKEFGRVIRLAVATPGEAVVALCAVLPGFCKAFMGPDGRRKYFVYVGRGEGRRPIRLEEAMDCLGATEPIRIVPIVAGAKRQGFGTFVTGLVLEAIGLVLTYYTGYDFGLISIGAAMQLGGIIQMLMPQPKGKPGPASNLPSYAFDGPINNTEQGGPVPVCYGRAIVGSVVVSQGIRTDDIVAAPSQVLPNNLGKMPAYEPPDPSVDPAAGTVP